MGELPMHGRVALVAGASRGIGAAAAEAFAAAGAAVVLAARDAAAIESVAQRIKAGGGQATAVRTDVTDADSVRGLVDAAISAYGRLDAAFNNATDGPRPAPLADIDAGEFDQGIATNIRGTFLGMKFQIPAMLAGGGGAIVNMASIAGLNATANLAAYVAGKAGIIGLTKVAALDYADRGIRVNVLAPGPILTHHLAAAGPEAQRQAGLSTPMRRVGQPAEVAAAAVWLCSAQSSFITGAVLPVDGGQSAGNKPPQMYRPGQPMAAPPSAGPGPGGPGPGRPGCPEPPGLGNTTARPRPGWHLAAATPHCAARSWPSLTRTALRPEFPADRRSAYRPNLCYSVTRESPNRRHTSIFLNKARGSRPDRGSSTIGPGSLHDGREN